MEPAPGAAVSAVAGRVPCVAAAMVVAAVPTRWRRDTEGADESAEPVIPIWTRKANAASTIKQQASALAIFMAIMKIGAGV